MMIIIIFCMLAFLILYFMNELSNANKRIEQLQYICKDSYRRGFCDACVQMEENRKDEG